jgi:hypothetical protein
MQKNMRPENSDPTLTNPGDEVTPGTPGSGEDVCPKCHGSGKEAGRECEACNGTGVITRAIGGG